MTSFSLFTEFDVYLFKEGRHFHLFEKLGSHLISHEGANGVYFSVWAPNAFQVSVIGSFNMWNRTSHPMEVRNDESGIWEIFVPGIGRGEIYKYSILTAESKRLEKTDPYAFMWETPPKTASVVWDHQYEWKDHAWMERRKKLAEQPQPYSVYEIHAGSWRRRGEEGNRSLSYREMTDELVPYVKEMGFTHIEFMPIMEYPYEPSWGYQVLGYYAPSSRFGTPQDFMRLIDRFHEAEIGVLLDWVPSHFPNDAHGIAWFDGTYLYEHSDPRLGFHPDWKSAIYNYGRNEVRCFLISNALFWLKIYHADGLRVDAVASMLYLDYSRKAGEWIPNIFGGNQNLQAISFLRELNETIYNEFPDAITIAEESTAYSGVSRPVYTGGLGFNQKWMMGWMHDTLNYMKTDPLYRNWRQGEITFSLIYAFTENFMLPLSHDEVVYGKGSLLTRMPGDEWQKFANLRLMYGYMFTHPGSRLLFMGAEIAQGGEWNFMGSLDWWLLDSPLHKGVQQLVKDLNKLNKEKPAIYWHAFSHEGFEWIAYDDTQNCVVSYIRKGREQDKPLAVVCHFLPAVIQGYSIGIPLSGHWREILNTDDKIYGGSGVLNKGSIETAPVKTHGREYSISITLAPLSAMVFEWVHPSEVVESKKKESKSETSLSSPQKKALEPAKKPVPKKASTQRNQVL